MQKNMVRELEELNQRRRSFHGRTGLAASGRPGRGTESATVVSQFAPSQRIIRDAVEVHRAWIEAKLGTTLGQALFLDFDLRLTDLAMRAILPSVYSARSNDGALKRLQGMVGKVEAPGEIAPLLKLTRKRESGGSVADSRRLWSAKWSDGPLAITLEGVTGWIVIMHTPFVLGAGMDPGFQETVICTRETAGELLYVLDSCEQEKRAPVLISGTAGAEPIAESNWDDLVLDQSVSALVRRDFETFFAREPWFRKHRLPFRRGYLFYGPPGNGKTSVIRTMMNSRGLNGYPVQLCHEYVNDDDLQNIFSTAADAAPALVIMEDIDRAFPRNGQSRSKISLQQLLNCLDGLGTQDGVIVVATANDPTLLDSAILRRPGRFDRVVCFPRPDAPLRQAYFCHLHPDLSDQALREAVRRSEGFSFAQVREAYILAGQYAFEAGSDLDGEHLLASINDLRDTLKVASGDPKPLGFVATAQRTLQP